MIGSPGGARIIPYVAQAIIGVLDWGLNVQQAIDLGILGVAASQSAGGRL